MRRLLGMVAVLMCLAAGQAWGDYLPQAVTCSYSLTAPCGTGLGSCAGLGVTSDSDNCYAGPSGRTGCPVIIGNLVNGSTNAYLSPSTVSCTANCCTAYFQGPGYFGFAGFSVYGINSYLGHALAVSFQNEGLGTLVCSYGNTPSTTVTNCVGVNYTANSSHACTSYGDVFPASIGSAVYNGSTSYGICGICNAQTIGVTHLENGGTSSAWQSYTQASIVSGSSAATSSTMLAADYNQIYANIQALRWNAGLADTSTTYAAGTYAASYVTGMTYSLNPGGTTYAAYHTVYTLNPGGTTYANPNSGQTYAASGSLVYSCYFGGGADLESTCQDQEGMWSDNNCVDDVGFYIGNNDPGTDCQYCDQWGYEGCWDTIGYEYSGYTCNAGDILSGSTCYKNGCNTYDVFVAPPGTTCYECNAGDTNNHNGTCTAPSGYQCNAGDWLSGTTCYFCDGDTNNHNGTCTRSFNGATAFTGVIKADAMNTLRSMLRDVYTTCTGAGSVPAGLAAASDVKVGQPALATHMSNMRTWTAAAP